MIVSREQISAARKADLYRFLVSRHSDLFTKTPRNLFMKENQSLVIHNGYSSYKDYATMETGNSVDFLTKYLGYSFTEAVVALAGNSACKKVIQAANNPEPDRRPETVTLPLAAPLPHSRMYAFLSSRGIPKHMIDVLSEDNLIYQDAKMGNVVFVNREKDYCELRGTFTFAEKAFHGCRKSRADRFWYFFGGSGAPQVAFVTEAAIDAISLFLIQKKAHLDTSHAVFVSIGGVSNDATIRRIANGIHTILAVDNDPAGDLCRGRHRNLDSLIPMNKDWNEDLLAL